MYHCATDPVLMHTGAGMVGMMVVKPRTRARRQRAVGDPAGVLHRPARARMPIRPRWPAKQPDVIAFNGYANQYKDQPIAVRRARGPDVRSERRAHDLVCVPRDRHGLRPDRRRGHGRPARPDGQPAPSQGGWVEFTLDKEGIYPFVTHAFGDMVKGAVGVLATGARPDSGGAPSPRRRLNGAAARGGAAAPKLF